MEHGLDSETFLLPRDADRIFNCNETGFSLQGGKFRVISTRGKRHVVQATTAGRQQITVLVTGNAAG